MGVAGEGEEGIVQLQGESKIEDEKGRREYCSGPLGCLREQCLLGVRNWGCCPPGEGCVNMRGVQIVKRSRESGDARPPRVADVMGRVVPSPDS